MAIRVSIVEDDADISRILCQSVESAPDFSLIATFTDAESFLSAVKNLHCDVVLMDIGLPRMNGIQAVANAKPLRPEMQFIMCTVLEDDDSIFNSLCVGASGYLIKNDSKLNLQNSIREVQQGGSPMTASIARRVVQSFQNKNMAQQSTNDLSPRQWELLLLLDKGLRYKEIAGQLNFTTETVRSYIRDIYVQLQVHSRTEALNRIFRKK